MRMLRQDITQRKAPMANETRNAIKMALIRLLDERPVSQITVKDIVTACGINRNTFYYHYQGIPELIEEIADDEAEAIIRRHPTADTLADCVADLIRAALEKKRAVQHIYDSASRVICEQYMWAVCEHLVQVQLTAILNGRRLPEDDWHVLNRYYACLAFGAASKWLALGMREDVLPDLCRIAQLQRGSLEEMITRSLGENK